MGNRAQATAADNARIGALSNSASPGQADGKVGMIGNDAGYLRIYVEAGERYERTGRFDDHDVIFTQRRLMEHIGSFVTGRGW